MLKKLILTASGGPFFGKTVEDLKNVTVNEALNHPNWSMGAKITIDSATMMNKGLEIIEARWLFDVQPENIDVVVHRESIIHSLIEYVDNSVIAQLGLPDMRIPIQYAITYPKRYESPVGELSLAQIGKMTFFEPDYDTFKCLRACKKALSLGGVATAIANGANEEANRLFREGKITFLEIGDLVMGAIDNIDNFEPLCVDDVLKADMNDYSKRKLIEEFDQVLSLDLTKEIKEDVVDDELAAYVEDMITQRKEAKKAKDFAKADAIRDELLAKGIELKDTREGTVWSVK